MYKGWEWAITLHIASDGRKFFDILKLIKDRDRIVNVEFSSTNVLLVVGNNNMKINNYNSEYENIMIYTDTFRDNKY